MTDFAANRTTLLVDRPPSSAGTFVLYWMIAQRRVAWNFGLDRAVYWARVLDKPLLVFEPLFADYPWASDRLHRFVLDGMADTAARLAAAGVSYFPYVEPSPRAGRGLLDRLASAAAVVVTDDYPAFFIPRIVATTATRLRVRFEQVDSNGLLPIRSATATFASAYAFRRFLQRTLREHIAERPSASPFAGISRRAAVIPPDVLGRWVAADASLLAKSPSLGGLPIDHMVPITDRRGGHIAADAALDAFLADGLPSYAERHSDVAADVSSGLSPYLHFGHLSPPAVVQAVLEREGWLGNLTRRPNGARDGWWGGVLRPRRSSIRSSRGAS